jgi:nitrite reductase (NADH) small subunit
MRNVFACEASEIDPGQRKILKIDGRSIGIFNIDGRFFALHNGCPHKGGALCEGPVSGTTLPTDSFEYKYGQEGRVLRCAWHGWEFDIESGQSLSDPNVRARTYPVTVDGGRILIEL